VYCANDDYSSPATGHDIDFFEPEWSMVSPVRLFRFFFPISTTLLLLLACTGLVLFAPEPTLATHPAFQEDEFLELWFFDYHSSSPTEPPKSFFLRAQSPPLAFHSTSDQEIDWLADTLSETLDDYPDHAARVSFTEAGRYSNEREKAKPRWWNDPLGNLGKGRWVLDFGYSYSYDSYEEISVHQHYYPDLLIRYSISDRWELQCSWAGLIDGKLQDDLLGLTDQYRDIANPGIGLKWSFCRQRKWRPRMLVVASAPIAMDGNPLAQENFQPMTSLIYGWRWNTKLSLSASSGLQYLHDARGDSWDFLQTVNLDRLWSERIGTYFQWSYLRPDRGDLEEHVGYLGGYFLMTSRFQLDTRLGVGLNRAAPDFIVRVGCSLVF
jgi:hypothetical protein